MTSISNMTLPDEVVEKVQNVIQHGTGVYCSVETTQAAIRATLQAMCDCGMAYEHYDGANAPVLSIKIRRLDSDEIRAHDAKPR